MDYFWKFLFNLLPSLTLFQSTFQSGKMPTLEIEYLGHCNLALDVSSFDKSLIEV